LVVKISSRSPWIQVFAGVVVAALVFFAAGYLLAPAKVVTQTTTISREVVQTKTTISTITEVRTAVSTITIPASTTAASDLRAALRSLLIQHGEGHRMFAYALYFRDREMQRIAVSELLANSKSLGDLVASVYGRGAGDKFTDLFNGHIAAVAMYYTSAFSGNESGKRAAVEALTKNAMEIAEFLSSANPYLAREAVFSLLRDHAIQAMKQADLLSQGRISDESQIYAAMRNHLIVIADAIAEAITKQFPDKFK